MNHHKYFTVMNCGDSWARASRSIFASCWRIIIMPSHINWVLDKLSQRRLEDIARFLTRWTDCKYTSESHSGKIGSSRDQRPEMEKNFFSRGLYILFMGETIKIYIKNIYIYIYIYIYYIYYIYILNK